MLKRWVQALNFLQGVNDNSLIVLILGRGLQFTFLLIPFISSVKQISLWFLLNVFDNCIRYLQT